MGNDRTIGRDTLDVFGFLCEDAPELLRDNWFRIVDSRSGPGFSLTLQSTQLTVYLSKHIGELVVIAMARGQETRAQYSVDILQALVTGERGDTGQVTDANSQYVVPSLRALEADLADPARRDLTVAFLKKLLNERSRELDSSGPDG